MFLEYNKQDDTFLFSCICGCGKHIKATSFFFTSKKHLWWLPHHVTILTGENWATAK